MVKLQFLLHVFERSTAVRRLTSLSFSQHYYQRTRLKTRV